MPFPSFMEYLELKRIGPDTFESVVLPFHMGNLAPIAYGGCVLGWACQAAHLSLGKESRQRIYSLQGCYTGPTATNRPVKLKVTSLRETRAFATRLVMVSQEVDGEERGCLSCIVDFYSSSGNEVLKYSAQPSQKVTHHSELMEITELHRSQVKQGVLSQAQADRHESDFGGFQAFMTAKPTPEGIAFENCHGIHFDRKTSQDDRGIAEKVSFDWIKPKLSHLPSTPQKGLDASVLAFILDGDTPFMPLAFSRRFTNHVKVCSSLDFSLRFHVDDLDVSRWHLREIKTHAAAEERTFSEAKCWREEEDRSLTLVATMSETGILRGPEQKVGSSKL